MRRSTSLQAALAAIFGVLALGLAVAASATAERIAAAQLQDRIGQELADYSGYIREGLDAGLDGHRRLVQTLADMASNVEPSPETWRTWLDAVRRSHRDYAWIGFADVKGTLRAASDGTLEGESVAARPWFKAALTRPFLGDVHEGVLLAKKLPPLPGGEPLRFVDVAAPVHDAGGMIVGVLGGHLSWTWARQVERAILAPLEGRRSGVEALIIRSDGEILLGPPELTGKRLDPVLKDRIAKLTAGDASGHAMAAWQGEGTYLVGSSASRKIDGEAGLGWTVLVRQPAEAAFAPVAELSRTIFLWGCALTLPFALVGWALAKLATRPLLSLVTFAERHRRGERGLSIPAGGYSEANSLSHALQLLLSDLSARDAALAASNRALEQRVEDRTRELKKAAALTHKVLENSPDVIIVVSPEGQIEFASRPPHWLADAERPDDIRGRTLPSIFPAESHADLTAGMLQACDDKSTTLRIFCPDAGGGQWLEVLVTFMQDRRNRPEHLLCIVRDVTAEHSQAEAQRQAAQEAERTREEAVAASRAKSDFLASMSHEIRTPLNAIIGFTGLILDRRDLQPDLTRQVGLIQSSGNALLTVVNDVLDFSKIEAGAIVLEPRPFSPQALVDNTLSIVRGQADAKSLDLVFETDSAISPWLVGDEDRLRQILLNLVNNAIKFTRDGSVTIRLQSLGATAAGEGIAFSVTDTGIGIPADKLGRLFQRFSQVDGSIRREFGGTGLGLAISQRLVEMMGGTISVTSEPWKGSCFAFTLALLPVSEHDREPMAAATPQAMASNPARILLAEDLEVNQEIARAILEAAGHTVDAVGDGAAALRAVEEGAYDVVLMDIQMPIMDGLTAAERIRSLPGPAARTPIIALTANVLADQIVALRRAGMDEHVGKPFRRADLLQAIDRCLAAGPNTTRRGEAGSGGVVLDRAILDDLIALGGPVQASRWLRMFEDRVRVTFLADGAAHAMTPDLAAEAHRLVSQAGMLGFTGLSEACAACEAAYLAEEDCCVPLERCHAAARVALLACGKALAALPAQDAVANVA